MADRSALRIRIAATAHQRELIGSEQAEGLWSDDEAADAVGQVDARLDSLWARVRAATPTGKRKRPDDQW